MKVVTYKEACATGKPFRYAGKQHPKGHAVVAKHLWRLGYEGKCDDPRFHSHIVMKCLSCGQSLALRIEQPDTWIVQKDDDELLQDAQDILTKLGLRLERIPAHIPSVL